jgi:1-acyl-sn-glycerol-3-phosphate acyltransferase
MIQHCRSFLFRLLYYIVSIACITLSYPFALVYKPASWWGPKTWSTIICWLLKHICGITYRVEGDFPTEPCLVLSNHQSVWETLSFYRLFNFPYYALKKELFAIPGFGHMAKMCGMIFIDRAAGASALKAIPKQLPNLQPGNAFIIFPQGTRVPFGQKAPYKTGYYLFYKHLKCPLVFTEHNAGEHWPNKGPLKPGVITLKIRAVLPPNQDKKTVISWVDKLADSV